MTNDDDRTELASALLDGTLPEPAAAAARRDPAVMARLAQLEQARDRVRDVPPAPVEARDTLVAAALDAFDTAPPASPVSDLQARRRARGERRQAPRWLGAAAAVALVLAGVGVVAVLSQQSADHEQAEVTAADDAVTSDGDESGSDTSASAEADEGAASAPEAAPAPSTADRAAPVPLGDLGSFASAGDLVTRVRSDAAAYEALVDRADTGLAGQQAADSGCAVEDLPEVLQDQAAVVALGTATVDGTAVTVWVADTPSGRRVVVVDGNCLAVANRPLG